MAGRRNRLWFVQNASSREGNGGGPSRRGSEGGLVRAETGGRGRGRMSIGRSAGLRTVTCLIAVLAAASTHGASRSVVVALGARRPAELPGLHNVLRVSEKLYSGAAPEGDPGFQSLRALGIRTVITVDGARPDVAAAHRYGLRYVHLPFGYDGCPRPRALEIIRAVRDLPGPIYLHCHHGRHRSAAAAALVHIALDGASNAEGVALMRRAGTDPAYTGLYGEAASFRRPSAAVIDHASPQFPETASLPPLAASMVQIDNRFTILQQMQKAHWKTPATGAALQLKELFHEQQRTGATAGRPGDFKGWMSAAENGSAALEAALRTGNRDRAAAALGRVAGACSACHARYRNVPQVRSTRSEKSIP
jgi:protein tyrosine phosphatase (PTP) superfamily phosphohydrolase (DUF442 family)